MPTWAEEIRDHQGTVVYVGNLPYDADSSGLKRLFAQTSEVLWADVVIDMMTGRGRGFGFVRLPTRDDALRCIEAANGCDFSGRKITVNVARPLEPRKPRVGGLVAEIARPAPLATLPDGPRVVQAAVKVQRLLSKRYDRPESLLELTSRQFEELVAEIFEALNYTVELTSCTRDGGYDIVAVCEREVKLRLLIECKRYAPPNRVGVGVVRALYGVRSHEEATKAVLATTSYLTRPAEEFVDEHHWALEARNCEGIMKWIDMARSCRPTNDSGLLVVDSEPGDGLVRETR